MPSDAPEPDLLSQPTCPPLELEPPGSAYGAPVGEIAGPARQGERLVAIDVLRGFALLGILVMNIRALGSIWQTYEQPYALGGVSGLDWWVWAAGHLLTAEKMMAIFSMLFGAGIVLMASRLRERRRSAWLHYRRMFWLLIIGLVHSYFIWSGDVLVWYALCGSIVYLAWRCRPWVQIVLGVLVLACGAAIPMVVGQMISTAESAEMNSGLHPSPERVEQQIAVYRGSWLEQMPHRAAHARDVQTGGFLFFGLWRAAGLMLLGMALFKAGVFSAARSTRSYAWMGVAGLAIGMPLVIAGFVRNMDAGFSAEAVRFINSRYNYVGSVFVALAWVALVMMVVKAGVLRLLTRALAAVGQMALTNYLMQSIVCTTIFYGHGLGLFGALRFTELMYVVFGVWIAELVWSPLWLRRFRFGPFEWLWRSLTYWQKQPIRRRSPLPMVAGADG